MQNVQEKSVKIGFLIKYKNGCYNRNYGGDRIETLFR